MLVNVNTEEKSSLQRNKQDPPSVFAFTDYRMFLQAFYEYRKTQLPNYSMSTFIRKAGLGHNSRGYLKLVVDGKRNLSAHTIRRFIEAMNLPPKDALYFENLVLLNQSKTSKDREFYLQRLAVAAEGRTNKQFELLLYQYQYFSHWYYIVIRELVALPHFTEDSTWIVNQLKNRITKKQAEEALMQLEVLGLLRRDPSSGKLVQAEPLVKLATGLYPEGVLKFHLEMIERAKEALIENKYQDRHASSVTLPCSSSLFQKIIDEIDQFRDHLCLKFGNASGSPDTIVQVNFQSFKFIK